MVKIYNIHSNDLTEEELKTLSNAHNKAQDIFLLNADLEYEIIDLDKMTVLKSKNFDKTLFGFLKRFKR